jgi:hypothetical protein
MTPKTSITSEAFMFEGEKPKNTSIPAIVTWDARGNILDELL